MRDDNIVQTGLSRRELMATRPPRQIGARPPHAVLPGEFSTLCDGCGHCVTACPRSIVRLGEDGLPLLDFSVDGCTFCGACTDACPTGALNRNAARPWRWAARIGAACLSYNGVTCRTCTDACEARAISFRLRPGGRDVPLLDEERCTGCGACSAVCPVGAITMTEHLTEPAS